jgi:hypothetical protein
MHGIWASPQKHATNISPKQNAALGRKGRGHRSCAPAFAVQLGGCAAFADSLQDPPAGEA